MTTDSPTGSEAGFANRRSLLRLGVAGAVGLAAAALAPRGALAKAADALTSVPIVRTPLSDSLHLFQGAGGNVVAATTADGVLMVDGGLEQYSPALLAQVAALSGGRKVELLFNTHWHWDHTGSNAALGRAGAKIVGSVTIGSRVRIGANAVVIADVPDGATAVGVPARNIPGQAG